MNAPSSISPTFRGVIGIVVFFAVLTLVPKLFSKQNFLANSGDQSASSNRQIQFPLEVNLQVIRDTSSKQFPRGKRVLLKDFIEEKRGPLLINFWASWCPPCLEELPSVEFLNRQLNASKDDSSLPVLITISVDDQVQDVLALEKTLNFSPSMIVLHDKDGELARSVGTTKFPETYLVAKNGKILYKWPGPQNWLSFDVLRKFLNS